jgi:hypothetical protein
LTRHGFSPAGESHIAGQDNEAVLGAVLGMSLAEMRDLAERQVLR